MINETFSSIRRELHDALKNQDVIYDNLHHIMLTIKFPAWTLLSKKQKHRYLKQHKRFQSENRSENRDVMLFEKQVKAIILNAKCCSGWDDLIKWDIRGNAFIITDGKISFKEKDAISDVCSTRKEAWQSALERLKNAPMAERDAAK
jgi:hypothetical protein